MHDNFEEKIKQIELGKAIFMQIFDCIELSIKDTFLLILTDNLKCINYGIEYLSDFIKLYQRQKVYVLVDNIHCAEAFSEVGGIIKVCTKEELQSLAEYFNLFHKKEYFNAQIVLFSERDGYGIFVEELLDKQEFTLEEYVAISLYGLKGLGYGE